MKKNLDPKISCSPFNNHVGYKSEDPDLQKKLSPETETEQKQENSMFIKFMILVSRL
jgi:hypothetical protein